MCPWATYVPINWRQLLNIAINYLRKMKHYKRISISSAILRTITINWHTFVLNLNWHFNSNWTVIILFPLGLFAILLCKQWGQSGCQFDFNHHATTHTTLPFNGISHKSTATYRKRTSILYGITPARTSWISLNTSS